MSEAITCEITEVTPLNGQPLQQLNRIAKRPPIDVEFQDLIYSVRDSRNNGGWKQLLKSVNGKFRCGELTAIMGPSGAGKSTLLNILAGYVSTGVKGSIKMNDRPRDMKLFNKLSSYIMQEDIIQPRLTTREAMMVAANLKLGSHITMKEKVAVVDEVMNLLGLEKCSDTRSEYLSGGQRKRLAVALELVNNPPVIFLDEPTSGLDNVAIKQCMDLLHKISRLRRTVICTIHQPSASLFETFDQVYILAQGQCVYNGAPSQLVPFLSTAGYDCPTTHTSADFILEVIQLAPHCVQDLSAIIQNGKLFMGEKGPKRIATIEYSENNAVYQETTQIIGSPSDIEFPISLWEQFKILICRMFLQQSRNTTMLYIQFFHHLLSGLLIGGIFYGIGNDASQTVAIFKYCLCVNVFFMYTHVMVPVILFPLEVKLMRREYFNRWYNLKAYYVALTLSTLPILICFGFMFLLIVYFMTDQPMEVDRFLKFILVELTVALCSQGLGYSIGSICNITKGSIVSPSILAPLLALSFYGMGYKNTIEPFMKMLMGLSYVRYGVVGVCASLLQNRKPLECEEIYCHYRNPEIMMYDLGMINPDFSVQVIVIATFTFVFRMVSFLALKYRMTSEFSNKIAYYAAKIIKQNE